jgi:8-oxo-dGTP pyrophosphatase MutT (NUDIX family)
MDTDGAPASEGGTDTALLPAAFGFPRRRYDRLLGEWSAPAALRDATSVLLVRDGDRGLEVFLLHRVAEMAFAGGMTVFPGGGLDARDRDPDDPDDERALRRSAVRELFEETGVLLAGPTPTSTVEHTAALAGARASLTAGATDLTTVLAEAGLVLRDDLLSPWARWLTPELMPKRYDTRFLVAAVPPGQEPDGATSEAAEAGWATPADALVAWSAGERSLMPPTWAVLTELAEHRDVASLGAEARGRRTDPVTPVPVPGDDQVRLGVPRFALSATALGAAS